MAAADVSSSVDRVASNKNAPGRTRAVEVRCRRRDDDKMAAHVDRYRYIYIYYINARHGSRPSTALATLQRAPPQPLPAGRRLMRTACATRHCRIYSGGPLGSRATYRYIVYRIIAAAADITYIIINLFNSRYIIYTIITRSIVREKLNTPWTYPVLWLNSELNINYPNLFIIWTAVLTKYQWQLYI